MARTIATSGVAELLARGNLTLPKALREAHHLKAGTHFTIIDLGGGSLMLVPRRLRVDALAEPLIDAISEWGESLDGQLAHLDAQRGRPGEYDAADA